jgi:hypothetical protein
MADIVPHFTDARGRRWPLVLTYGLAQRIRTSLDVDLANAHTGEALTKLGQSDELFVATLFALVEDEAGKQSVTPADFAEGLNGEVFEAAARALEQMLLVFIRPALRPVLEAVFQANHEKRTKVVELAKRKLTGAPMGRAIDREVATLEGRLDAVMAGDKPTTSTSSRTSGRRSRA